MCEACIFFFLVLVNPSLQLICANNLVRYMFLVSLLMLSMIVTQSPGVIDVAVAVFCLIRL